MRSWAERSPTAPKRAARSRTGSGGVEGGRLPKMLGRPPPGRDSPESQTEAAGVVPPRPDSSSPAKAARRASSSSWSSLSRGDPLPRWAANRTVPSPPATTRTARPPPKLEKDCSALGQLLRRSGGFRRPEAAGKGTLDPAPTEQVAQDREIGPGRRRPRGRPPGRPRGKLPREERAPGPQGGAAQPPPGRGPGTRPRSSAPKTHLAPLSQRWGPGC